MRTALFLSAAICCLTCSLPALAADAAAETEVDTVIVTGTKAVSGDFGAKSGIPIERVPQSVQIVSAQDIIEQGATSVGDLLRDVPSANPGYSRVGAYQSFSLKIRGFMADQMRNGIRQRYYEDVDASALSNIERVEVLKGPSGVLYGQSAVGGIVSIITKRPTTTPALSLSGVVGSHQQKMLSADYTGGLSENLSIRLTGELERSGTFVDFQDMNRFNAGISLRYAPSDKVSANLVAEYVQRETSRNPGLPVKGTVESNGVGTLDRGLYLGEPNIDDMTAHAPLIQAWVDFRVSEKWTVTPRLQYQEFNTDFNQIRVRAADADLVTIARNGREGEEDDEYYIAQLDFSGSFRTGALEHRILAGFEYDKERGRFTQSNITNVTSINATAPVYAFATTAPVKVFAFDNFYNIDGQAVYLQDQIELTRRWNLIAAARRSWIDASDGAVGAAAANQAKTANTIWQVGSTLQVADGLSVYAGYNTGFDVESSAAARSADGSPLKPEESSQSEIGLRLSRGAFRGSLSLFEIRRTNALTTDADNPDFSLNVGEQRVRGVELEGTWQVRPDWSIRAGYAWLDSEITRSNDGDQGKRIGDVPEHSFTARTEYVVPGTKLALRGGIHAVSDRLLVNGSSVVLPSYTLAEIGAGYRFDRVALDLTVNNLLDEDYFTASGNSFAVYPGDPRTVSLRLSRTF